MIRFVRRHAWSYIFILPTLAFFAVFTLIPVLQAFALSLQNATIVGGTFVGVENFVTLARDPIFVKAIGNTILYTLIVVAAQIGLALLIAGLLQPLPARGQMFYRASTPPSWSPWSGAGSSTRTRSDWPMPYWLSSA
jgi:multiple sugar transport system permease protein